MAGSQHAQKPIPANCIVFTFYSRGQFRDGKSLFDRDMSYDE